MSNPEVDLIGFVNNMKRLGWQLHLQKGLKKYGIPDNIHLTLSPIHDEMAEEFLEDAAKAVEMKPDVDTKQIYAMVERGEFAEIVKGIEEGRLDSSIVTILLESIPEDFAAELIKNVVMEWFR